VGVGSGVRGWGGERGGGGGGGGGGLATPLCKINYIFVYVYLCVCLCTAIIMMYLYFHFTLQLHHFLVGTHQNYNQQPIIIIQYKVYYFAMALTPNHSTCICVTVLLCPVSLD